MAIVTPERLRRHDGRLCVATPGGALKRIAVLYRRTDEDRLHRLAQRILAEGEANSSQGGGAKDTWIVPDATA